MDQSVVIDIMSAQKPFMMASRATSMPSEDGDSLSPQVLLAQLQALQIQNRAVQPHQFNVQYNYMNNHQDVSAFAAAAGGYPNMSTAPFMQATPAAHAAQLAMNIPQVKRGPHRQRRNEEQVRRTIYINDLDHIVSERDLASFFQHCGPIIDCRICGDANSAMRFAFIEFHSENSARAALSRTGATLGTAVIRVSPSKTAIVPVNNQYLPRSEEERSAVARTVYVSNIHRAVERDALHAFFLNLCGTVSKIRLLGDTQHDTKIAFVEFATPEGAAAALKCTGALLGPLPIRVSASKTPVRTDSRRTKDTSISIHCPQNAINGGVGLGINGGHGHGQDNGNGAGLTLSRSLPSLLTLQGSPGLAERQHALMSTAASLPGALHPDFIPQM